MPRPASGHVERHDEEDHGWPQPAERLQPVEWASSPSRSARGGRSALDVALIALALLGLAAAVGAAAWYLHLRRSGSAALSVPRVIGFSEREAVHELTTEGFAVRAIEQPASASAGVVFAQRPSVNTVLARGAVVTISVANGQSLRSVTASSGSR